MRSVVVFVLVGLIACTNSSTPTDSDARTQTGSTDVAESTAPGAIQPTDEQSADADQSAAPSTDAVASPNTPSPNDPELDCDRLTDAKLVRSRSIPGGHQLHLSVAGSDREPEFVDVVEPCLRVTSGRLGDVDVAVGVSERQEGATLVVARWLPDEVDASRRAVDTLLLSLPPTERVAVWAWSDSLIQVVGATRDRDRITRRLDAVWTGDTAVPLDVEVAADVAAEEWEDYGDNVLLGNRSIVFVAPGLDLPERPDIDRDIVVDHWIVRSGEGARVVEVSRPGGVPGAVIVGEAIELAGNGPLMSVAFCDDGGDLDLTISTGTTELRSFGIGDAAVEHIGLPCDVEQMRRDGAASSSIGPIAVSFDGAQRARYDEAVAVADELTAFDRFEGDIDPEWDGSISLGGEKSLAPFEASYRGQSSIECDRRNWSIDLDGGDARHPIDGTGVDEFILGSLCQDAGLVNTLIGSSVMARLGLWTQATDTTTFEIDGEPQGVYLVVEDPETDLRQESSRTRSVVRRRYDVVGVEPDVLYADGDVFANDTAGLAPYDELLSTARASTGEELISALRARFDLDQYLRWTGVMSILGSGDHIDELYFVGEESVDSSHTRITWLTINGWDPDDLFAECHRNGRFAIDDPAGLLSCTESLLDAELFTDPDVYDLYAAHLRQLLDGLTVEEFREIADVAVTDITRHLGDPDVVAAMVDSDVALLDPGAAVVAVEVAGAQLVDDFIARRATLEAALTDYQASN